MRTAYGHYHIHLPLIGGFQAHNAMAAAALTIAAGADEAAVIDSQTALVGAPGRLQLGARSAQNAAILVDYAHTPDALATMLNAVVRMSPPPSGVRLWRRPRSRQTSDDGRGGDGPRRFGVADR